MANQYAEAVKKGGDYWRNYLVGEVREASVRNDIYADTALFDQLTMRMCSGGSKFIQINGGGYSASNARVYRSIVSDYLVMP